MASRALLVAAALLVPSLALADDDDGPPPPPPPPPPSAVISPTPLYVAPLAQMTQTTYVPQSVALSGPEEIEDYDTSRPIPLGYTPVERTRRHMIVGGAVTLGVTYGISSMVAAIGDDAGETSLHSMWIPVAGPFLEMSETSSSTARLFLAGLGGAQLAGAIMLYVGMTTKDHVLVRNDLVGGLTVTPLVTHDGGTGMVLSGRF
ncbi:MAG: hypothetical protein ABI678_11475 [Kofleriaceae bacterium]